MPETAPPPPGEPDERSRTDTEIALAKLAVAAENAARAIREFLSTWEDAHRQQERDDRKRRLELLKQSVRDGRLK